MVGHGQNRLGLISIQDQIMDYYRITNIDYNLLQSLYSWPNVITATCAGIMVDKIGLDQLSFIAWLITLLSVGLMCISSIIRDHLLRFPLLCISRSVTGVSNEGFRISLKVFVTSYFKPDQYGLILGTFIAISTISASINLIITYQIYAFFDSIPIALSWTMCLFIIVTMPLLIHKIKQRMTAKSDENTENTGLIDSSNLTKPSKHFHFSELKGFPIRFWLIVLRYFHILIF